MFIDWLAVFIDDKLGFARGEFEHGGERQCLGLIEQLIDDHADLGRGQLVGTGQAQGVACLNKTGYQQQPFAGIQRYI